MKRTPAEEAARWFRQSKMDLDDARFAAEGKRYHLACFLAQQAAEKALKAFLYERGAEAVWGHSVAELCGDASQLDGSFADLMSQAAPLDKYYVPTRYPNGLPGGIPSEAFVVQDADLAIGMAARVLQFVEERL
jgi:HEPN domain-containing protein